MKALLTGIGIGVLVILVGAAYVFTHQSREGQQNTMMQNNVPTVHPIEHASLVLSWGGNQVYADPVGSPDLYTSFPDPALIVITHMHGDHFSTSTLEAVVASTTKIVVPESVESALPEGLKSRTVVMKNGDTTTVGPYTITALPSYNVRSDATQFHPKGRDNGYVIERDGVRVYIAGDSEDTREMRALTDIDIAFVPMNLPYTMPIEKAAEAVLAFKSKQVYPYHYRGPDGLSDVQKFKSLVEAGNFDVKVVLADWYSH